MVEAIRRPLPVVFGRPSRSSRAAVLISLHATYGSLHLLPKWVGLTINQFSARVM
jgi:hypothetical protein